MASFGDWPEKVGRGVLSLLAGGPGASRRELSVVQRSSAEPGPHLIDRRLIEERTAERHGADAAVGEQHGQPHHDPRRAYSDGAYKHVPLP
jgi:hypothetical protein